MNERDELARLLPAPAPLDLPPGRHQQRKDFLMNEIQSKPRHRLSRWTVLTPVLGGLTALAVVGLVLVGGETPAYAVSDNADGTITIKIYEAKDAKGLQATLRERGFNVIVDYVPDDKRCMPQPRSTTWVPGVTLARPQSAEEESQGPGFRIDPSVVKPGQTAVLEFLIEGDDGEFGAGISDRVSDGPVADCTLVDRESSRSPDGDDQNK